MFDFISYVRDTGLKLTLTAGKAGELVTIKLFDPVSKYRAKHTITDKEASSCANIDIYTRRVLDALMADIGRQKAHEYAGKETSRRLRERERFFREG